MSLIEKLLDLLFPKGCVGCGKYGAWICNQCISKLQLNLPECFYCRRISTNSLSHCKCTTDKSIISATIIYKYAQIPKRITSVYKYDYVKDISAILAKLSKEKFRTLCNSIRSSQAKNGLITVTPIPLSKSRQNQRGFNQVELFAKQIVSEQENYISDLLLRELDNTNQAHLSKELRRVNSENLFKFNTKYAEIIKKNSPVIIIDDVVTTGSTIRSAVNTLSNAGFVNIYVFALFRGTPKFSN
jgi:ComF family protein